MNDAAVRGDTVDTAIARFEAGISVEDQVAPWEDVEQKRCADINAATTTGATCAMLLMLIEQEPQKARSGYPGAHDAQ